MSLMVVMARESARAIVVIRDLHASAPAQLIARKPLHECELAHLPAKRSAEDADVSAGSLALLRPFARSEFGIVLDGFAVDILQVERGIHDAAIAAETLGFIERGVGFSHQRGLVERRAGSGGDARADGDVSAAG